MHPHPTPLQNKAEELAEVVQGIPLQVLRLEKLENFPAKVVNMKALPKKTEIEGELKALNKLCKSAADFFEKSSGGGARASG